LRLMAVALIAFFSAVVGVNYLANPYGAWRPRVFGDIYRLVENERVVVPYLLRTARPETLLVGSSRVMIGIEIEQGIRSGVMNAALSGATLQEIAKVVELALRNPRLKRVIWGLDFFAFDENRSFCVPETCARLDGDLGPTIMETLLSLDALSSSQRTIARAIGGTHRFSAARTSTVPWPSSLICQSLPQTSEMDLTYADPPRIEYQLTHHLPRYGAFRFSRSQFELFRAIVGRIRRSNVALTIFIPPLSEYELEGIRQSGKWAEMQQWKRELSNITEFWDFCNYTQLARTDRDFLGILHFKPPVGHLILRQLLGDNCLGCCEEAREITSAAKLVASSNVDEIIAGENAMMESAAHTESPYAKAVAEVLKQSTVFPGTTASLP
jgi:hypothetical protein